MTICHIILYYYRSKQILHTNKQKFQHFRVSSAYISFSNDDEVSMLKLYFLGNLLLTFYLTNFRIKFYP